MLIRCPLCKQTRDSVKSIKIHLQEDHIQFLPWKCSECLKRAATSELMTEHYEKEHKNVAQRMSYVLDKFKKDCLQDLMKFLKVVTADKTVGAVVNKKRIINEPVHGSAYTPIKTVASKELPKSTMPGKAIDAAVPLFDLSSVNMTPPGPQSKSHQLPRLVSGKDAGFVPNHDLATHLPIQQSSEITQSPRNAERQCWRPATGMRIALLRPTSIPRLYEVANIYKKHFVKQTQKVTVLNVDTEDSKTAVPRLNEPGPSTSTVDQDKFFTVIPENKPLDLLALGVAPAEANSSTPLSTGGLDSSTWVKERCNWCGYLCSLKDVLQHALSHQATKGRESSNNGDGNEKERVNEKEYDGAWEHEKRKRKLSNEAIQSKPPKVKQEIDENSDVEIRHEDEEEDLGPSSSNKAPKRFDTSLSQFADKIQKEGTMWLRRKMANTPPSLRTRRNNDGGFFRCRCKLCGVVIAENLKRHHTQKHLFEDEGTVFNSCQQPGCTYVDYHVMGVRSHIRQAHSEDTKVSIASHITSELKTKIKIWCFKNYERILHTLPNQDTEEVPKLRKSMRYCQLCEYDVAVPGQTATSKAVVALHVNKHMWEKFQIHRYSCGNCGMKFHRYDDVRRHEAIVHNISFCYNDDIHLWPPEKVIELSQICFADDEFLKSCMPNRWLKQWNIPKQKGSRGQRH